MSIVVLSDVIMPESVLAAGVRGKQIRRNTRTQSQSGTMQINVEWARTLRQYELGTVPMTVAQWQAIEGLQEVTEGGAFGFLLADPKDCTVDASSGLLSPFAGAMAGSIGLGYGVPSYRLYKRYAVAGSTRTKDRAITRPQAVPSLQRAGAAVALGAGAGQAVIDYTTGTVTFVPDTTQALVSVTTGASTVLNFSDGVGIVAALVVGQRVYLSGVTGSAAATLNSVSHEITAKGASSLTISTATTGLAAASGTAYKYPQAGEALTWTGRFYVPVHFAGDELDWELVRSGSADTRLLSGPSVVLQEIRE